MCWPAVCLACGSSMLAVLGGIGGKGKGTLHGAKLYFIRQQQATKKINNCWLSEQPLTYVCVRVSGCCRRVAPSLVVRAPRGLAPLQRSSGNVFILLYRDQETGNRHAHDSFVHDPGSYK